MTLLASMQVVFGLYLAWERGTIRLVFLQRDTTAVDVAQHGVDFLSVANPGFKRARCSCLCEVGAPGAPKPC